jgi:hypothetical protein
MLEVGALISDGFASTTVDTRAETTLGIDGR